VGIQNFPAALQPIIQQGILEHEFEAALHSRLAYRAVARRESIPNRTGETVTKTKMGLLGVISTPMVTANNTGLDNGLSVVTNTIEQYSLTMQMYANSMDLNTVTDRVGIASQFVLNAKVLGEQARRSLDGLAQAALFNYYFQGNTWVYATLGAPGTAVHVDDVRGFQYAFSTTGFTSAAQTLSAGDPSPTLIPTSSTNQLTVIFNNGGTLTSTTLNSVAVDGTNVSVTPGGVSGVLTFSANVSIANATVGNGLYTTNASVIKRPGGAATYYGLTSSNTLAMANILDAVAQLRANAVPGIGGDTYNCYLDPISARQLFADPDFKQLFQNTARTTGEFQAGELESPFLGVRFIPTTQAYVQAHPTLTGLSVRRPLIVGAGALIEGDFAGMAAADVAPKDSIISQVDDVVMVTREPLDRLQQIIAQSWYWIGGFTCPTDVLTNTTSVPTANKSYYKRAVMIEHIG
jgi:hypothetical protein